MNIRYGVSILLVVCLLAAIVYPDVTKGEDALLEVVRRSGAEDVIEVILENPIENPDGTVSAVLSIKALKRIAYNISFENDGPADVFLDSLETIEFLPLYPHNTYFVGRVTLHPESSLIIRQDKWGTGSATDIAKMTVVNASVLVLELLGIEPLAEFDVFEFATLIGEALSVIPFGDASLIATHRLITDIESGADAVTILEDLVNLIKEFPGMAAAIAASLALFGFSVSATTVVVWITVASLFVFGIPRLVRAIGDWTLGPSHVETEIRIPQEGHAVDVFMLVDLTGSFANDLPVFKAQAPDIISTLKASNANTQFGLAKFEDYPISPFGDAGCGDKAYERLVDLTLDAAPILDAINGLFTRCGADGPESQLPALFQAATGAGQDLSELGFPEANIASGQQANFRDGANKVFMLWTDAPFHQPGDPGLTPYPGQSIDEVVNAILALDPPKVIGISSGGGGLADLQTIAAATGAFAPEGGVDCNADGIIDIIGGQPLVCSISSSGVGIGEAINAVVGVALGSPIASAGPPYFGRIGESIIFDGSASFDPDGTIVLYEWDFESDGVNDFSSTEPTASHSYPGEFSGFATLQVTDNDGLKGSSFAPVVVKKVADLSITKSVSPDPAPVGRPFTYTLNVTNNGPDDATEVLVSDAMLSEVDIISVNATQGTCVTSTRITICNMGLLSSGSSATVTIIANTLTTETITNTAFVEDGSSLDFISSNNHVVEETDIVVIPYPPTLDGIDNADGDGTYIVSWSTVLGAHSYEIQERMNGGDWETLYVGPGNSIAPAPRAPGVWCYQVRAINISGVSDRSNIICTTVYEPAVADFVASPTTGRIPLKVHFTNLSTGDYSTCTWAFGDGGTSNDCDPDDYGYRIPGVYTVTLNVNGPGGEDEMIKEEFIDVQNYGLYLPVVLKP